MKIIIEIIDGEVTQITPLHLQPTTVDSIDALAASVKPTYVDAGPAPTPADSRREPVETVFPDPLMQVDLDGGAAPSIA